jgi:hypothetical protein
MCVDLIDDKHATQPNSGAGLHGNMVPGSTRSDSAAQLGDGGSIRREISADSP